MFHFRPRLFGFASQGNKSSPKRDRRVRPSLEVLEGRLLLDAAPSYVVDSLLDNGQGRMGAGDLRWCINQADGTGGTISFAVSGTIQLTSPLPTLSNNIKITNNGEGIQVIGKGVTATNGGIFNVAKGATVEIDGLYMGYGTAMNGGGIYNAGTLTLNNDSIDYNMATQNGGGIFNASSSTLTLQGCTISNNFSNAGGGIANSRAIDTNGGDLIVANDASLSGGGIWNAGNSAKILSYSDTIFGNSALNGLGGGIWNTGSFTLYDGQINQNNAYYGGGGVDNVSGTVNLYGTDVQNNSVTKGNGGGLLLNANSTTTFDNDVVISGNKASGVGAGIGFYSGATMNFAKPYPGDKDDPGGNPVQVD